MSLQGQQVLLKTPLSIGSGYGADGIALAQCLEDAGAVVHLDPTAVGVPLPLGVAQLLARPRPDHFDLMLQHLDIASLDMPAHVSNRVGRAVGWSMWEFGSYAGEGFEERLAERLYGFDLFLGYTKLTVKVTRPYLPVETVAAALQGGYDSGLWQPKETDPIRSWESTFKYGMVVTSLRKNPWAALNAFSRLKQEHGSDFDAELHFKVNGLWLHPKVGEYDGVHVHLAGWTHQQMRQFYLGLNCLLAPSLGEGKDLPPMEAGSLGCPSILSRCAGHEDWAMDEFAYRVVGVVKERDAIRLPGQTAFYVDEDELAAAMWRAYCDRAEARRKGELAAQLIPAMFDWSKVVERLGFLLGSTQARSRPIPDA